MATALDAREALEYAQVEELNAKMDECMTDAQHDATLLKVFKSDTRDVILYMLTPILTANGECLDLVPHAFRAHAPHIELERDNPTLVSQLDNPRDRKIYGVELTPLDAALPASVDAEADAPAAAAAAADPDADEVFKVDMALMRLVQCESLHPHLILDADGRGELRATVAGRPVRLDYAYAHMRPALAGVSMVDVLHIYGTDVETGEGRAEVIVPPPEALAKAIGMFL